MKKISLFFTTPVRKRMEEDGEFVRSTGFLKAMRLGQDLVGVSLLHGLLEKDAKAAGGVMWKYFHHASSEGKSIQKAIAESWRVEITISFAYDQYLNVTVRLYRKNGTNPYFCDAVAFLVDIATANFSQGCPME